MPYCVSVFLYTTDWVNSYNHTKSIICGPSLCIKKVSGLRGSHLTHSRKPRQRDYCFGLTSLRLVPFGILITMVVTCIVYNVMYIICHAVVSNHSQFGLAGFMYVTAREKKLPNICQLKQEFLKNTIPLINCFLPPYIRLRESSAR